MYNKNNQNNVNYNKEIPIVNVIDIANVTTCDNSCAKNAIVARNQDYTAWLARGEPHVDYMQSPRAKQASIMQNHGYPAQLAQDKSHV